MSNEVQQPEERSRGDEDSIQVVARFRPLNDSEERAGSKFIVSFPQVKGQEDTLVSIAVSKIYFILILQLRKYSYINLISRLFHSYII